MHLQTSNESLWNGKIKTIGREDNINFYLIAILKLRLDLTSKSKYINVTIMVRRITIAQYLKRRLWMTPQHMLCWKWQICESYLFRLLIVRGQKLLMFVSGIKIKSSNFRQKSSKFLSAGFVCPENTLLIAINHQFPCIYNSRYLRVHIHRVHK